MNLNKISTADKDTRAVIGTVAQMLIDDIAANADLRVELSEKIGFDKGYDIGFKEGYAKAQASIRAAHMNLQVEMGLSSLPEEP